MSGGDGGGGGGVECRHHVGMRCRCRLSYHELCLSACGWDTPDGLFRTLTLVDFDAAIIGNICTHTHTHVMYIIHQLQHVIFMLYYVQCILYIYRYNIYICVPAYIYIYIICNVCACVCVCVCIVPCYIASASARHGMAHGWRGPSTARNNALRVWDNTMQ